MIYLAILKSDGTPVVFKYPQDIFRYNGDYQKIARVSYSRLFEKQPPQNEIQIIQELSPRKLIAAIFHIYNQDMIVRATIAKKDLTNDFAIDVILNNVDRMKVCRWGDEHELEVEVSQGLMFRLEKMQRIFCNTEDSKLILMIRAFIEEEGYSEGHKQDSLEGFLLRYFDLDNPYNREIPKK